MNSAAARTRVATGELTADQAVDALCAAGDHGGVVDRHVACPECGTSFVRTPDGRMNTCSDACQADRTTAIFELDSGHSIVRTSEFTPARLGELLRASGMSVCSRAGKVFPS